MSPRWRDWADRLRPFVPPPRWRAGLTVALTLAITGGALVFLLHGVGLASIRDALLHPSGRAVVAALALTAVSFACLAGYDALGAELVAKGRVPLKVSLLAGAAGCAIANTVGFHAVSGTSVRAHLYLRAGLGAAEVARIASLSWLALVAGNATMFAVAELWRAAGDPHPGWPLAIGGALVASLAGLAACLRGGAREVSIFGFRVPMPSASLALAQMAIGAIESGTAIGALYVLLPRDLAPPFDVFAIGCIVAVTLGVVAHAPGGIGVFEASITALLAGRGRADLLAALLLYRLIYNLLPFMLAMLALGWRAGWRQGGPAAAVASSGESPRRAEP